MSAVQLGFAEKPEDGVLTFTLDDFPNKIGGKPMWLNQSAPLKATDVTCGVCEKPMVLLLQFYTPEDHPIEAYHRVIYVFCCRNGACHKNRWQDCFKAYRSQLPEVNEVYTFDEDSDTHVPTPTAPLCNICGLSGPKKCSKCKAAQYCSKEHQVVDWNEGGHKHRCESANGDAADPATASQTKVLFPEFELVSEDEPEPSAGAGDEDENDEGESLETKLANVAIEGSEAIEDMEETEVDVDKAFLKFQKRVLREPEQVIRYARVSYEDGKDPEPLWVSDSGKPQAEHIPACPHCHGPRVFEFQAMPQLLNVLDINHFTSDALDWGTIIVYSCVGNCQPEGQTYMEETVWRQMFSEHGMGDSAKAVLERERALAAVASVPKTA
ncbi:programmed cell death protein 2 [Fimicolochytrium jonesii]|uniref:programmed cell death protein 2 n=1 Tax=Fimicolochytrium jonesii TaxID=1396493 RepID=UPI0022FF07A1|nr:programmed cell death protein 2 [Fimicolochytrium jonesii]KAI8825764.1 programmed cell death protein 2 [Fimicolochytrium jonesii]